MSLNIKYIVLSDLHLGEEDSLFTPSKNGNNNLLNAFTSSLQSLVHDKNNRSLPMLILNGDILGLSFSTYQESLIVFEQFIQSITVTHKICNKIAYIPGNHDHHIWQLAMESNYRRKLANRSPDQSIPSMDRITKPLYRDGLKSEFIEAFVNGNKEIGIELKVIYPNMIIPPEDKSQAYIIIHHGHYAESTYQFISNALHALYPQETKPKSLEGLELENGAWINFAFSELGRSGNAGELFERLMNVLSSIEMFDKQSEILSENIAQALDYPYIPFHAVEKFLTRRLINNIAQKIRSERYQEGTVCSLEAEHGLTDYLEKYCTAQLQNQGWTNESVILVWGHTHKPFHRHISTEIFSNLEIVNSGGWVLPKTPKPTHGGSIALISNTNEVVNLRIWNDTNTDNGLHFEIIKENQKASSDFENYITSLLYDHNGELRSNWADFKKELSQEIYSRRKSHKV